jgi:hypothetical protein
MKKRTILMVKKHVKQSHIFMMQSATLGFTHVGQTVILVEGVKQVVTKTNRVVLVLAKLALLVNLQVARVKLHVNNVKQEDSMVEQEDPLVPHVHFPSTRHKLVEQAVHVGQKKRGCCRSVAFLFLLLFCSCSSVSHWFHT